MRKLLLAIAILAGVACHAQTYQTQCNNGIVTATSTSCTLTIAANEKLILTYVHGSLFGNGIPTFSDTFGLTWSCPRSSNFIISWGGINGYMAICYASTGSSSGSDTVTMTPVVGGGADYIFEAVFAYTNVGTYDAQAGNSSNGTGTTTTQNITTAAASEPVFLVCYAGGTTASWNSAVLSSSTLTLRLNSPLMADFSACCGRKAGVAFGEMTGGAAGTQSPSCTSTVAPNSGQWATAALAFGTAAPTGVPRKKGFVN